MKKTLRAVISLIVLAAMAVSLISCGGESTITTAGKTEAPATTTTAEIKTEAKITTAAPTTTVAPQTEVKPAFADGSKFKVDGVLDEWTDIKKLSVVGDGAYEGKKVDFYACLTDKGLYIACEAYHNVYTTGVDSWWLNTNLEFFLGLAPSVQFYVYANGMDSAPLTGISTDGVLEDNIKIDEAVMNTSTEDAGSTNYHTITEVFIALESLPTDAIDYDACELEIGIGWKTSTDNINNGACNANADGSDEYWVVAWPSSRTLYATPEGLVNPLA